ncbi:MAG TPA: hypothetical protein PKE00_11080 [Planctomycetota bacterium]|nr:hypothetical protein [Planctomycetota bacterium]
MHHTASPDHNRLVDDLVRSLALSSDLVRSATNELRAQRQHFVALRGEELAKAPAALAKVSDRLVEAERERAAVHEQLATLLKLPPATATLARVAERLPKAARLRVETARRELREAAEALGIEAAIGERLLDWSATCHENTLRRLFGNNPGEAQYGPDGRQRTTKDPRSFVNTTL